MEFEDVGGQTHAMQGNRKKTKQNFQIFISRKLEINNNVTTNQHLKSYNAFDKIYLRINK